MKTFTIENGTNSITAHPTAQEATSVAGAERFATADALARLAANWPSTRLVEIWNTLPGATPVKKFTDRKTAVTRIWKAIQSPIEGVEAAPSPERVPAIDTAPAVAEAAPHPDAAPATPRAPQTRKLAPKERPAKTTASFAKKPPPTAAKEGLRVGSKTETILNLMKRPDGVSLQEIMQATGWQAHSVRGFISGTLGKKMRLTVLSTRTAARERIYSIQA